MYICIVTYKSSSLMGLCTGETRVEEIFMREREGKGEEGRRGGGEGRGGEGRGGGGDLLVKESSADPVVLCLSFNTSISSFRDFNSSFLYHEKRC